jgi:hypothetical protein
MGPRPAVTKAMIWQRWETFFAGTTPAAKRIELAENGDRYASTIREISALPLAKQAAANVTAVELDGPMHATVTFTLLLNGSPVVEGVKGSAVLVDGVWQVSIASLCELAALQGTVPKACPTPAK